MYEQVEKAKENKGRAVANSVSQKSSGDSAFQFVDNRPEAVVQRKLQEMVNNSPQVNQAAQLQATSDNHSAQQNQPVQKKENYTGLPDDLKSGIENLSGRSMDDVKVHYNSDKPVQLNAHAYAQGTDIHLASGQEKHLPHEAWHVVQQKQGRVKPTMQMKGKVNVNDDAGLEKEADLMGKKAVNFFLHQKGIETPLITSSVPSQYIQRKVEFKNIDVTKDMVEGYFISRSPIVNGMKKIAFPGMIESSTGYRINSVQSMYKTMDYFVELDPLIGKERTLLETSPIAKVYNRHHSAPPLMGAPTKDRIEKLRTQEVDTFEKNLKDDLKYFSVYYRQLDAITGREKGSDHIPGDLRPATVLDNVEMQTSVGREGKEEEDISAEYFFERHPRLIRIIHSNSHKFIRDQFMQAIDSKGNSVILQNPNMSIDPEPQGEKKEKYKTNEIALEKILQQVKGSLAPVLKEILTEHGDGYVNTQVSFGNFLPLPPSDDSITGHLLVGGDKKGELTATQKRIAGIFSSKLIVINTEWLRVGHVDEIISVIPWKDSKFGFKVLVADQNLTNSGHASKEITELLDGIARTLITVLGEDNIVRVPGLYVKYKNSPHKEKSSLASLGGPDPEDSKYVSAFPNMTNLAVLNDHSYRGIDPKTNPFFDDDADTSGKITLIVPDPEAQTGEYGYFQSEAKEQFTKIVAASGNEVHFADDMSLHVDGGDIHCGTFELREPHA
ncbi:MAG: hypothetical protein ACJAUV_001965 [Flavobacteriales bacterium]|jgi:hypothetical protein